MISYNVLFVVVAVVAVAVAVVVVVVVVVIVLVARCAENLTEKERPVYCSGCEYEDRP